VCETTGVQDDKVDIVGCSLLHPVDEFVLGVALKGIERMSVIGRNFATAILNVRQPCRSVDIGLSGPQKVQVWAVDEKN
jgi:hypothetical protein